MLGKYLLIPHEVLEVWGDLINSGGGWKSEWDDDDDRCVKIQSNPLLVAHRASSQHARRACARRAGLQMLLWHCCLVARQSVRNATISLSFFLL